jgi:purine-binding chemotaxis protein CheW
MTASQAQFPPVGAELIMVQIGDQQFAIDIMSVREIRGWAASTPLPHAPPYVHGMINLRGLILPVVDLGSRLGLASTQPDSASVVVVAEINGRQVGLLVDAVCDILLLTENMLQETPDVGAPIIQDFVQGVMTTDDGIVTLLCLNQVLPGGREGGAMIDDAAARAA